VNNSRGSVVYLFVLKTAKPLTLTGPREHIRVVCSDRSGY